MISRSIPRESALWISAFPLSKQNVPKMEHKEIKTAIILSLIIAVLFKGFELKVTKKHYADKKLKINITEVTTYTLQIQQLK